MAKFKNLFFAQLGFSNGHCLCWMRGKSTKNLSEVSNSWNIESRIPGLNSIMSLLLDTPPYHYRCWPLNFSLETIWILIIALVEGIWISCFLRSFNFYLKGFFSSHISSTKHLWLPQPLWLRTCINNLDDPFPLYPEDFKNIISN